METLGQGRELNLQRLWTFWTAESIPCMQTVDQETYTIYN